MAIQETPTNYRIYYKSMKDAIIPLYDETVEILELNKTKLDRFYSMIESSLDAIKKEYKIDFNTYEEFASKEYVNGKLLKTAVGLLFTKKHNEKEDPEAKGSLVFLYNYAKLQKENDVILKNNILYNKLIHLTIKEYNFILKTYYTEVHKKLIIKGYGYAFTGNIGWICINRCKNLNAKPCLDFAATKKREKELIENNKRIYNKNESAWCEKHGIEYKAEDKRVFRNAEYFYEIPLINCTLKNGNRIKLEMADYRHKSIRGKSNKDIIKECNNNINKICEVPIDLKSKLSMCIEADFTLYTNFIKNENQKSINFRTSNRKDR